LELVIFAIFLVSLGEELVPLLKFRQGQVLVIGTLFVGLLLPLALHLLLRKAGPSRAVATAFLALLGGFVLRYGILTTPPEILARASEIPARYTGREGSSTIGTPGTVLIGGFSPEDGRRPGGGPGADPGNKSAELEPRSKVFYDGHTE
jgi:hypothetical protein